VPAVIYYQIKRELFDLPKELILLAAIFTGMMSSEGLNFGLEY